MACVISCDECSAEILRLGVGQPELHSKRRRLCEACIAIERDVEEEVAAFAHGVAMEGQEAVEAKRAEIRERIRRVGM